MNLYTNLACMLVFFASSTHAQIPDSRTFKLDIVELFKGNETPGNPEFAVDLEDFRYLFASEANKNAFRKNPEHYKVQMDGGCGRMGSLSGRGSTSLWAIHKNKLYVFASDACRTRFLKNPDLLWKEMTTRQNLTTKLNHLAANG